jgi:hypothetical protein
VIGGEGGAGDFFDLEGMVGGVEDGCFHGRLPGVRLALRGIAVLITVVRCWVGIKGVGRLIMAVVPVGSISPNLRALFFLLSLGVESGRIAWRVKCGSVYMRYRRWGC